MGGDCGRRKLPSPHFPSLQRQRCRCGEIFSDGTFPWTPSSEAMSSSPTPDCVIMLLNHGPGCPLLSPSLSPFFYVCVCVCVCEPIDFELAEVYTSPPPKHTHTLTHTYAHIHSIYSVPQAQCYLHAVTFVGGWVSCIDKHCSSLAVFSPSKCIFSPLIYVHFLQS